jgi:hypothetical protein
MITVYANDDRFEIKDNTILGDFLAANDFDEGYYTVNGNNRELDTILENYNVIEEDSDNGRYFDPDDWSATDSNDNADNTEFSRPNVVEIDLNDFTGHSGKIWIADNVAAVQERYNQPVSIKVVRDGVQHDASAIEKLQTGDMLFVAPNGGLKGA